MSVNLTTIKICVVKSNHTAQYIADSFKDCNIGEVDRVIFEDTTAILIFKTIYENRQTLSMISEMVVSTNARTKLYYEEGRRYWIVQLVAIPYDINELTVHNKLASTTLKLMKMEEMEKVHNNIIVQKNKQIGLLTMKNTDLEQQIEHLAFDYEVRLEDILQTK